MLKRLAHTQNRDMAALPAGDLAGGVHLLALAQEDGGGASLMRLAHMAPAHAGAGLLAPAQSMLGAPSRDRLHSLSPTKKQACLLGRVDVLNVDFAVAVTPSLL